MKQFISTLAVVVALIVVTSCSYEPTAPIADDASKQQSKIMAAPKGMSKVPDHYIVIFNDAVNIDYVSEEIVRLKGNHDFEVTNVYSNAIAGFSCFIPPGQLKKLAEDSRIQRIEEDFTIQLNPVSDKGLLQGATSAAAQSTPWGITAVGGFVDGTNLKRPDNTQRLAFIIDTGIDPNTGDLTIHPSLNKNFVSRTKSWYDGNGHGTHVAGTIAAKNNSVDVVGVAAGATVVAVRVLDSRGSGQYSWIIAGVDYVAKVGGSTDVANMSLGGGFYITLNNAIIAASGKGIRFALAAGNSSTDCSTTSPASTNGNGIFTVSAHDVNKYFASFSNYGAPVDFCAPGVNILSSRPGGGTVAMSGTSMAAPHVAGLLMAYGNVVGNGTVIGDKDSSPDPLAYKP